MTSQKKKRKPHAAPTKPNQRINNMKCATADKYKQFIVVYLSIRALFFCNLRLRKPNKINGKKNHYKDVPILIYLAINGQNINSFQLL